MNNLQSEIEQSTPFESIEEEVFLNLVKTLDLFDAPVRKLMKQHGVSPSQYNVLRILAGHRGEGLPMLKIAERMVSREPDITRLIDRLEEQKRVKRVRSKQDRRVVLVQVTAKGKKLAEKLKEPLREQHRKSLKSMSKNELSQLNRLLFKARSS